MSILIGNQLSASPIAMGCRRMTLLDRPEAEKLFRTAVELGINFFDNSDIYTNGEAEKGFGVLQMTVEGVTGTGSLTDQAFVTRSVLNLGEGMSYTAEEGFRRRRKQKRRQKRLHAAVQGEHGRRAAQPDTTGIQARKMVSRNFMAHDCNKGKH